MAVDDAKADSPSSPSDKVLSREDLYLTPGKHDLSVDCRYVDTFYREMDRYGYMIITSKSKAVEVELLSDHLYRWLCVFKQKHSRWFLIGRLETDTFTLTLWDVTGGDDTAYVVGTWNLKGVSHLSFPVPNITVPR